MDTIRLETARAGQVLARAVTNTDGAVLCPAGLTLTDRVIERLKRAGIESITVEGAGQRGLLENRLAELDARFRRVEDPLLQEIRSLAEKRLRLMLSRASAATEGSI